MTAPELTNGQARALADAREYYSGVTGYMMPDGVLVVSAERYSELHGYVLVALTCGRTGDRLTLSDGTERTLREAREHGRRI